MRISHSAAYLLGVAAAVAMLAGCSSGGSQSTVVPSTTAQSGVHKVAPEGKGGSTQGLQNLNAILLRGEAQGRKVPVDMFMHRHHAKSWFKHLTSASGSLLYVSDPEEQAAYVYAWNVPGFSRGTMVGQIGGPGDFYFVEPTGMCVDKSNNVYIVDAGGPTFGLPGIYKYAPNTILPTAVWSDPGNVPFSCSVDSAGDIAVANFETTSGGSGSVYVYPGGSTNWTPYYNIGTIPLLSVWFVGYDAGSNLYADGEFVSPPAAGDLEVNELAKGASYFNTLTLSGVPLTELQWPGNIQFALKRVTIGDGETVAGNSPAACIAEVATEGCAATYSTKVSGGVMTQLNVTNYIDTPYAYGTWIAGSDRLVVVPNGFGNGTGFTACAFPEPPSVTCTLVYNYGLGVSPIQEIDQPNYQLLPYFSTISQ